MSDLPEGPEEAFLEFEGRLRGVLESAQQTDRNTNRGMGDEYLGNFLPDRYYVTSVLGFLDEYNLEIDVPDISGLSNEDFNKQFSQFFTKINYAKTRYSLRAKRFEQGIAGTAIEFSTSYKEEIAALLNTIRKIVNQEIEDQNKKDEIFKKLAALQLEVDRDRATVDAIFSRMLDVTDVIGKSAENLEPLFEKMERLKSLFFDGAKKVDRFPKSKRPKQITQENPQRLELDDDIPF